MSTEEILTKIAESYLNSHDYNGISVSSLVTKYGEAEVRGSLSNLVEKNLVSVVFGDYHPNPHIKALPSEPKAEQIEKLNKPYFKHACAYPNTQHLEGVVDQGKYSDRPFELCLALGQPQLSYKSFDLSILEFYRNDPRYNYQYDDIHGFICIKSEYSESASLPESDQILLESFGFSIDDESNIYVAVFLRYLSNLSPEHQLIWASKQVDLKTYLHPDYHRTSIIGDFPEKLSLYQAVLLEIKAINDICEAIEREPLFRDDFFVSGRPREFGYLLRPTLKEFNDFVHLLDKMLSENINRKFFKNEVSFEKEETRSDGKIIVNQKGTIQILEDWLRDQFRAEDWSDINEMFCTFRHIRKLRQKPAHSVDENEFDQKYIKEQQELMKSVYRAVKILRVVLAYHPAAASIKIEKKLKDGLIWSF